ncbi:MAG: FeoB-associated Cys-rich membrane protein [Clostridiales bacterium]|nr:FeoB-associated Cys-rich membrane protein [Clostridiales bacterium]MCD7873050.1 FeoB-associated Cys-rich membrane protein [Clostridiales bacterium]
MGTVIVLIILAVIVGAIIYKLVKDKKSGKNQCGGDCAHCGACSACHTNQKRAHK